MLMPKANRTQKYGVRDNSNLNTSIQASQATANMYDTLTNSFLQLSDMATTSAINGEIRDAKLEGKQQGIEASAQDKDGSFEGYTVKSEIFKWDVASNQASKASFDANVNHRASSVMKNLASESNGDKATYETVAKEVARNATANVSDEMQRTQIDSAYAKAYNQNMGTVSKQYIKVESKMAKDGWDNGRTTFEEDYGIALAGVMRKEKLFKHAMSIGDDELADKLSKELKGSKDALNQFKRTRLNKARGAIEMGVVSPEGAIADTHTDIVKAISTSYTQAYSEATTVAEKDKLRNKVINMPEEAGSTNELFHMSPKSKAQLLESLDAQELNEQKMWSSNVKREDAEYNIQKKDATTDIQTMIIDESEDTLDAINDAYQMGYITPAQKKAYVSQTINGSQVDTDNWGAYTDITGSVEDYTITDIASRHDLTDETKRSLIGKRMAWDKEGKEWMTAPDYKEGKDIIRETYGYTDASMIPDIFGKKAKGKYVEMQGVIQKYRDLKRQSVAKGNRDDGVAIAEQLIRDQKENLASGLQPVYKLQKEVTVKQLTDASIETGKTLEETMAIQKDKYPDTKIPQGVRDVVEAKPPKKMIEGESSLFGFIKGDMEENPDYIEWAKGRSPKEIKDIEDTIEQEAQAVARKHVEKYWKNKNIGDR